MNAFALLFLLVIGFALLLALSKKEQDFIEDTIKVEQLLLQTNDALDKASDYVGKEKAPHNVMEELDGSLCKLMTNIRADKEEATKFSVLYGHFKHVLDEFLVAPANTSKYGELKHHIEEQYSHIHHELAAAAQKRGMDLASSH